MNGSKNIIGNKIIVLDKVNSTNAYLQELTKKNDFINEGLVVFSKSQIDGKGLGKNKWESEDGKNIAMSFYIKPEFLNAADNYTICRFVALAVCDFVISIVKRDVAIKWPNDIYYQNKKIAGILIENNISGSVIKFSLVGIGININQQVFKSDAPNPVSLINIMGRSFRVKSLLKKLCLFLDERYSQLLNGGMSIQELEYLEKLFGFNTWLNFKSENLSFEGKIIGVSPFGHLIIQDRKGKRKEFEQKEIQFIFPDN